MSFQSEKAILSYLKSSAVQISERNSKRRSGNLFSKKLHEGEWWEDSSVVVAYPKISEILSRLMGSNVVQLANRKFMVKFEKAIADYYKKEIEEKAQQRKNDEIKRIQELFFNKANDSVPEKIANHPIFQIRKKINNEAEKRRSKFVNSKKLYFKSKLNDLKKEQIESIQQPSIKSQKKGKLNNVMLEEQYIQENSRLGLDLLRIENNDWSECELDLKKFLESEKQSYFSHKRTSHIYKTHKIKDMKSKDSKYKAEKRIQPFNGQIKEKEEQLSVALTSRRKLDDISEKNSLENFENISLDEDLYIHAEDFFSDVLLPESNEMAEILQNEKINRAKFEDPRISKLKTIENMYDFMQQIQELILVKNEIHREGDGEELEEEEEEEEEPLESA